MGNVTQTRPHTLALFQKRLDGDDALLALAALRFRQAGLGAEFYANTPDELDRLWELRPTPDAYCTVHLNRRLNMLDERNRDLVVDFASRFQERIYGLVMHDQPEMVSARAAYTRAAEALALRLEKIGNSPILFVEYAAGLEPDQFAGFFEQIRGSDRISACIDIGHVGIRQARQSYAHRHCDDDVCALTPDHPRLPELVVDVQEAVCSARPTTIKLIQELGKLGKPLHFHLHDGHPLSAFSPYRVSDHLSFLYRIPIPFEYEGKWSLAPLYGPSGLSELVSKSLDSLDPAKLSFTLEIHVPDGRLPLRDAKHLFAHWQDKTNAERMNQWLWVLLENHQLLESALEKA